MSARMDLASSAIRSCCMAVSEESCMRRINSAPARSRRYTSGTAASGSTSASRAANSPEIGKSMPISAASAAGLSAAARMARTTSSTRERAA